MQAAGVEPWPGGERDHFIKIGLMRVTGRRIGQTLMRPADAGRIAAV
jgi:hypothetical protein